MDLLLLLLSLSPSIFIFSLPLIQSPQRQSGYERWFPSPTLHPPQPHPRPQTTHLCGVTFTGWQLNTSTNWVKKAFGRKWREMDRHIIPDTFILPTAGRRGGRWWILWATRLKRPWGVFFFSVGNHNGMLLPSESASEHISSCLVAKLLSITGNCSESNTSIML